MAARKRLLSSGQGTPSSAVFSRRRCIRLGSFLCCALTAGACATVRPLDAESVIRHSGFLRDGVTTVSEIDARLGGQHATYEGGRIRVYQVFFDKQNRLTLKNVPGENCHALVLILNADGRLVRHGLVEHGCRETPP